MAFDLDHRLASSSAVLCDLGLCHARLQHDVRYPWIVLIPRRDGARELEDLSKSDREALMDEIVAAGAAVRAVAAVLGRAVEKLNVGALGNITPQLHVHVVGRHAADAAWPGPVWGVGEPIPYSEAALERAIDAARAVFGGGGKS